MNSLFLASSTSSKPSLLASPSHRRQHRKTASSFEDVEPSSRFFRLHCDSLEDVQPHPLMRDPPPPPPPPLESQSHPFIPIPPVLPSSRSSSSSSKSSSSSNNKAKDSMIWRRAKIAATDVASVGNASDTLVPLPAATGTTNPMLPSVASPHCCTGRDLHESAKTWLNAGQYHKALTAFQAILKAQIQRFETLEHASVGAALHNVGVCYQRLEQFQKAKDVLQQAVEIRTNTLGEDHLEVAASLIKLGATKARLQELDDAFDDILLAIRIAKDNLGREHKTIAQMYCHLACFYYEANQLHAAQATFMEAYELYRIVWPKSSSISTATNNNNNGRDQLMQQMCDTLCNIGSIQNKRQQYDHAVLTFTEALALQRNSFEQQQQQHQPRILATLDNLAYSYSKMKDYKKALECYKNMLQAQLMTIDDDDKHLTTTASMHTLKKQLLMYDKLKDRKGAMQAANTTLQIAKKKKLESMVQQVEALIQERRWSSVPDKKN